MANEKAKEMREKWSHLSDEEYTRMVREGEAHSAVGKYLRQKALPDLGPDEERVYEYNEGFPFPITPTASEMVSVVLESEGDWGLDIEPDGDHLGSAAVEQFATDEILLHALRCNRCAGLIISYANTRAETPLEQLPVVE